MRKPAATVRVTNDRFDQMRAAQVGVSIGFNRRGEQEYQFDTREQHRRYMELGKERGKYLERLTFG